MNKNCCEQNIVKDTKNNGVLSGILYGLFPHVFCILFIMLSIIGASFASVYVKQFLDIPYFYPILIVLSIVFATISAFIYLRNNYRLNKSGLLKSWKYLLTLYLLTIGVNIVFMYAVFPAVSKKIINRSVAADQNLNKYKIVTLMVDIPCPGHAPLIDIDLKEDKGVKKVEYTEPNIFKVYYDEKITDISKILSIEIFKTYSAKEIK